MEGQKGGNRKSKKKEAEKRGNRGTARVLTRGRPYDRTSARLKGAATPAPLPLGMIIVPFAHPPAVAQRLFAPLPPPRPFIPPPPRPWSVDC